MLVSTNLQPPNFAPTQPIYPELPQIVRIPITSGNIGNNTYPAITQQYSAPLTFRDREPCYLHEPNGIPLGPGYYDCRLVSSFLGLPLYASTCCPGGSFSPAPSAVATPSSPSSRRSSSSSARSSRSSGSPSSVVPGIQYIPIGSASSGGQLVNSLSITPVTSLDGMLFAIVGSAGGNATNAISASFGGIAMAAGPQADFDAAAAITGSVRLFFLATLPDTDALVLTVGGGGTTNLMVLLVNVTGLVHDIQDVTAANDGLIAVPTVGPTAATFYARDYAQGAFLFVPSGGGFTWEDGFLNGQSISNTVGGFPLMLTEGHKITSNITSLTASLSPTTPSAYAGLIGVYA